MVLEDFGKAVSEILESKERGSAPIMWVGRDPVMRLDILSVMMVLGMMQSGYVTCVLNIFAIT